jgi:hypothetical protein
MRYLPDNKAVLTAMNPQMWQLAVLSLNPTVVTWDPLWKHDSKRINGDSLPETYASWGDFVKAWGNLDEHNELAHFYFEVEQKSTDCIFCQGSGEHPDLTYEHQHRTDFKQKLVITADELDYLVKEGHILSLSHGRVVFENGTYYQFKESQKTEVVGKVLLPALHDVNKDLNYDGVKKWVAPLSTITWQTILRARRLINAMQVTCDICEGHGKIFTGDTKLTMNLWIIQPEDGAGHGIKINDILKEDLEQVFAYLKTAEQQLLQRFRRVTTNVEAKLEHIKSIPGRWKDHSEQASAERSVDLELYQGNSV